MVTPAAGLPTPGPGDAGYGQVLGGAAILSELDRRLEMLESFEGIGREEASVLRARRDRLQAGKDEDVRLIEELGAAGQTIMAAVECGEGVGSDASGLVSVRVTGAFDRVEVSVAERASELRDPGVLADAVASAYAAAVGQLQQGIVDEVARVSQGRPLLMAWVRSAQCRLEERAGALGFSRTDPADEESRQLPPPADPPDAADAALDGAPPGHLGWRELGGAPERSPGHSALG